jgi:hypothetical protein
MATENALIFIELEAGGCWSWPAYFGEKIIFLLCPRFEHQIFLRIS